jgi:putative endonuclease
MAGAGHPHRTGAPARGIPASRAAARDQRRRELARLGERVAAAHLSGRGFVILGRNVRTRRGEIDLIALDRGTLVFAEVKTRRIAARQRTPRADQDPLAGLRAGQRTRIRRLAAAWLSENRGRRPGAAEIRFDALGVILDTRSAVRRVQHIEAAW